MITYLYWIVVALLVASSLFFFGRAGMWKAGVITGLVILLLGWLAFFFHFQQLFVKNYGGVMSIEVPKGQLHLSVTWKDDNLWVENYDPKTNTCYFNEYSRRNVLQGSVEIENCNPLVPGPRPVIIGIPPGNLPVAPGNQ